MECSDFVSNSNYNIMIKKIQSNGNSISSCLRFIFLIFILNILFFYDKIIKSSEYFKKYYN